MIYLKIMETSGQGSGDSGREHERISADRPGGEQQVGGIDACVLDGGHIDHLRRW
jgi:hypothetical protein